MQGASDGSKGAAGKPSEAEQHGSHAVGVRGSELKSRIQGFGNGPQPPPLPSETDRFWGAVAQVGDSMGLGKQADLESTLLNWYGAAKQTMDTMLAAVEEELVGELRSPPQPGSRSDTHPSRSEDGSIHRGRAQAEDFIEGPGIYSIQYKVRARNVPAQMGKTLQELHPGDSVRVIEVVHNRGEQYVWGHIEEPDGWIQLADVDNGHRFATFAGADPEVAPRAAEASDPHADGGGDADASSGPAPSRNSRMDTSQAHLLDMGSDLEGSGVQSQGPSADLLDMGSSPVEKAVEEDDLKEEDKVWWRGTEEAVVFRIDRTQEPPRYHIRFPSGLETEADRCALYSEQRGPRSDATASSLSRTIAIPPDVEELQELRYLGPSTQSAAKEQDDADNTQGSQPPAGTAAGSDLLDLSAAEASDRAGAPAATGDLLDLAGSRASGEPARTADLAPAEAGSSSQGEPSSAQVLPRLPPPPSGRQGAGLPPSAGSDVPEAIFDGVPFQRAGDSAEESREAAATDGNDAGATEGRGSKAGAEVLPRGISIFEDEPQQPVAQATAKEAEAPPATALPRGLSIFDQAPTTASGGPGTTALPGTGASLGSMASALPTIVDDVPSTPAEAAEMLDRPAQTAPAAGAGGQAFKVPRGVSIFDPLSEKNLNMEDLVIE